MKRLIAPAKDMGKLVLMHTDGKLDKILPILYNVGININHPIEQESNDIFEVKQLWAGRMALIGKFRTPLARLWNEGTNRRSGQRILQKLAPGGGYVLGSSTNIMDGIPPENFVAMVEAVYKYGRYGA